MADAPSGWPQFASALRKQALMDEMRRRTASSRREPIAVSARMRRPAAWLLAQAGEPAEFCANRAFFAALKSEK
jgi:hypothetical protein